MGSSMFKVWPNGRFKVQKFKVQGVEEFENIRENLKFSLLYSQKFVLLQSEIFEIIPTKMKDKIIWKMLW